MRALILTMLALIACGTAWAQTASDPLQITSGVIALDDNTSVSVTYAGNGFVGSAAMGFTDSGPPLGQATNPQFGFNENLSAGRDDSNVSFFSLTGYAPFTGAGTFDGGFGLLIEENAPTEQCPACVPTYIEGSGGITVTMVEGPPAYPGELQAYYATQETLTFDAPPAAAVPEPGTLALLAFGLVGVVTRRKLTVGII